MTLTTVGDKRVGPTTPMGQVLGGVCAVAGVFILALPVPIVVNSFATCYKNQMWRNEVSQKRLEQLTKINVKNKLSKNVENPTPRGSKV